MDALSHILDDIHLSGAEYIYVAGKGEWSVALKGQTTFHIVLKGPARLSLPGHGDHVLETGDIAFIPAGHEHHLTHLQSAPPTAYHWLAPEFRGHRNDPVVVGEGLDTNLILSVRCLLDSDMGKPLLTSLPACMLIRQGLDGSGPEWLKLGLSFLSLEAEIFRAGRDTLINRLIGMFLIECVRDYVEQIPDAANNWLSAVRDPYLSQSLSAIHADPARSWSVAELAELACLSRSAFHERFSDTIGMAPLTYLTEHRLRLAARHLSQRDLSINKIAERVGYGSETAFSQAFRRKYEMTPSQFRKNKLGATEIDNKR
ncbi:Putative araC-like transcription regulator [gamma proteobacterium HdN1]|nr:Putative araC-like transcription regulator [gamma proteobacterium HdN1]